MYCNLINQLVLTIFSLIINVENKDVINILLNLNISVTQCDKFLSLKLYLSDIVVLSPILIVSHLV